MIQKRVISHPLESLQETGRWPLIIFVVLITILWSQQSENTTSDDGIATSYMYDYGLYQQVNSNIVNCISSAHLH